MEIKRSRILLLFLGLLSVVVAVIFVSRRVSTEFSITPNAPISEPLACKEECPGSDGVLRNCTGGQDQSLCAWQGRLESCGGSQFCCPNANGSWTRDLSKCVVCTATPPKNLSTVQIDGTSQMLKWSPGTGGMTRIWLSAHPNPTANCSGTDGDKALCVLNDKRITDGSTELIVTGLVPNKTYYWRAMTWKQDGCDAATGNFSFITSVQVCLDTSWSPAENTVCSGTSFTQTSNCGRSKNSLGTKNCTTACTPDGTVKCSPDCQSSCGQPEKYISTCKDSCGALVTKKCPATDDCCVDTAWLPDANMTCTGEILTQTSNCGNKRSTKGTKYCCSDSSWSPEPSLTCIGETMVQTSNCGTNRQTTGTKVCSPNLTISTNTFEDDPRNKPGVYFTDKKNEKVSRGQQFVYTIEIKNEGTGKANNVVVTNSLTGQNQNLLTFIDAEERCKFDLTSKKLICNIVEIASNSSEALKFRVRLSQLAINGRSIRNTASVSYNKRTREASIETQISSIVTCNEYCTNDSECEAGIACDAFTNKCRKPTCLTSTSCNCTITKSTPTPIKAIIATKTPIPTTYETGPTSTVATVTNKYIEIPEASGITGDNHGQSNLPEAGIMTYNQGVIVGSGLIITIIGILLAL